MAVEMEKRIVFEPGDILHIGIVCGNPECGEELFYPAHRSLPDIRGCPYCRADWTLSDFEADKLRRDHFTAIIRELASRSDPPWRIKLTFSADAD